MKTKYLLLWLPMIAIAFLNATLRELVFTKFFNPRYSNDLSTVTLTFLCGLYIGLIFPKLDVRKGKEALFIGGVWIVLTILFEFGLGLLTHHSLNSLLQQYNLLQGNIWVLFLLCLSLFPYLFYRLRKR